VDLSFFVASTARGGGPKAFFELANHLARAGHQIEILSQAREPDWFALEVPFRQVRTFPAPAGVARKVVVSHLFQIPLVWQSAPQTPLLWFCLGYDGYAQVSGAHPPGKEDPVSLEVMKLPVAAITCSRSVSRTLEERGKPCRLVPWSLDGTRWQVRPPAPPGPRYRIAMVVDPVVPLKGFDDAAQALSQLRLPVTLVLVTRNLDWQPPKLDFPLEIHRQPELPQIPEILASCHALCCSSWYEGLGLPALEAMALGLPVVSTRNLGVQEYAQEEKNLLLADVGCSDQIAAQLERVLTQPALAQRLRQGGLDTVRVHLDPAVTARAFVEACQQSQWHTCPAGLDFSDLLARLRQAGHYLPAEWVQEQTSNYRELLELSPLGAVPERVARLRSLRERLRLKRGWHPVFQAQFDACQLLLAFPEHTLQPGSSGHPICH